MATQYASQLPFLEVWNARDEDTVKFVDEWLRDTAVEVFLEESPFAKALKVGKEIATLEPSQVTQRGFARELTALVASAGGGNYTMTFSGKVNGRTLDADLLAQHVKKGTVFQKVVSGSRHLVEITASTIDSLALACKAYGGTSMEVDSTARTWKIISTPWSDKRDFEQPTGLPRDLDHTFTQIFMREVEATDTEEDLRDKVIKDPFKWKIEYNLKDLAQEKASALINMSPQYDTNTSTYLSGYDIENPGLAGLFWWTEKAYISDPDTDILVDLNDQPVTPDHCYDLGHALAMKRLAKLNKGTWQLWGHPTTMQYVKSWEQEYRQTTPGKTTVGFDNKAIYIEGVEVPFMRDRHFPESELILVDVSQIEYGPFKRGGMRRKEIPTRGFYTQYAIREHVWGLLPRDNMIIGRLSNIRPYGT